MTIFDGIDFIDVTALGCVLPPDVVPGSEMAFKLGCTCPMMQPKSGKFRLATDCPVHVTGMLDFWQHQIHPAS